MAWADILLQIDSVPRATPDTAIDQAVAFASHVGARLSGVAVQVDIPLVSNPIADRLIDLRGLEKAWEAESLAACRAAVRHFEAAARAADVYGGAEIVKLDLYTGEDALAWRARTRDLCLVPLADRYDGQREVAQQLIFQSGRPVLAYGVDKPLLPTERPGRVALAWDGSRSAARAMADALPLLRRALGVTVVTFVHEKATATPGLGGEALRHLSTHGVEATAREVDPCGEPIGVAIDDFVRESQTDLLVMGAYGHSRLREFVLGGATEHVLRAPPTALFLSH